VCSSEFRYLTSELGIDPEIPEHHSASRLPLLSPTRITASLNPLVERPSQSRPVMRTGRTGPDIPGADQKVFSAVVLN